MIDRTEAMTVVDVNTGKFVGSGGNLEETVTKNNLEAAEEIVRQLRLRDIGGIIVVDFIDMVLESNRDLVLRRLVECLSRDRTKHQVAEVTSLGLVQMTRKKLGLGLLETFSEPCEVCGGRGIIVHHDPVTRHRSQARTTATATAAAAATTAAAAARGRSSPPSAGKNGNGGRTRSPRTRATPSPRSRRAPCTTTSTRRPSRSRRDRAGSRGRAPVAILDIPVKKSTRSSRKVSSADAEQLLGSVLEALPEPKEPGRVAPGCRGGQAAPAKS